MIVLARFERPIITIVGTELSKFVTMALQASTMLQYVRLKFAEHVTHD